MLSKDQLQALSAPFRAEDHEIRFGNGNKGFVQWLAYLTRPAITQRLHRVLGSSVSDRIVEHWNDNKEFHVIVEVSYMDSTFQAIGSDTDYMSAETRAYKRALTHLGVGLYLYNAPTIQTRNTGYYDADTKRFTHWTDEAKAAQHNAMQQLEVWLNQLGSPPPAKTGQESDTNWTTDPNAVKAFYEQCKSLPTPPEGKEMILEALDVDKISDYAGSPDDALSTVKNHMIELGRIREDLLHELAHTCYDNEEVEERYNHETHVYNALKKYDGDPLAQAPLTIVNWLVDRKADDNSDETKRTYTLDEEIPF